MPRIRDVPRDSHDLSDLTELPGNLLELGGTPGIEHELPAPSCQRPGERPAETPRRSGDDGQRHGFKLRRRAARYQRQSVLVLPTYTGRARGESGPGPDQPDPDSEQRRLSTVAHAKLLQQMADVGLDGLFGDPKLQGDPLVGTTA